MNRQELVNLILMGAVFVLVFSAWSICVVLWVIQYVRRQKQLQQRLGVGGPDAKKTQALQLWRREYESRRQPSRRRKETLSQRLERLRLSAGWKTSAPTVFLRVAGLTAVAFAAASVIGYSMWVSLGVAAAVPVGFGVFTKRRVAARVALSERQFIDALGVAARALRAGHPLVGAFQLVSEEVAEPTGNLFGEICQEQALGLDLESSMRRIGEMSRNEDLRLFATAVSIQLSSGGNLAELMDTLASVMRVRVTLHRRVRVLTAQTNMSKWILMVLPVGLFILLNIISPEYMELFYTTIPGRIMLIGTAVSVLVGAWMMEKLSVIRY